MRVRMFVQLEQLDVCRCLVFRTVLANALLVLNVRNRSFNEI